MAVRCASAKSIGLWLLAAAQLYAPKAEDCAALPKSMSGASHPSGCPGAVWSNGKASKEYCENRGSSKGRFTWWAACCGWNGKTCEPKAAATPRPTSCEDKWKAKGVGGPDCRGGIDPDTCDCARPKPRPTSCEEKWKAKGVGGPDCRGGIDPVTCNCARPKRRPTSCQEKWKAKGIGGPDCREGIDPVTCNCARPKPRPTSCQEKWKAKGVGGPDCRGGIDPVTCDCARARTPPSPSPPAEDCAALPKSMNGASHPSGCPGAVWSNGKASQAYCENKGSSKGRFTWWAACCGWNGKTCEPKAAATPGPISCQEKWKAKGVGGPDCRGGINPDTCDCARTRTSRLWSAGAIDQYASNNMTMITMVAGVIAGSASLFAAFAMIAMRVMKPRRNAEEIALHLIEVEDPAFRSMPLHEKPVE